MRSSIPKFALVFLLFLLTDARAQISGPNADTETSPVPRYNHRVPSLIIQGPPIQQPTEVVIPSQAKPSRPTARKPLKTELLQSRPAPPQGLNTSTGNPSYDRMVLESAKRNSVDPNLIVAVMKQESGFNPGARSYKGACGLMQLIPATARRFGVSKIYDPAQNIEGGARYLHFLLDLFQGNIELALAGYNAGEGAVIGAGYKIPRWRETVAYVKCITTRYGFTRHAFGTAFSASKDGSPAAIIIPSGNGVCLSNNY